MDGTGWIILGAVMIGAAAVLFTVSQILLSAWIRQFNGMGGETNDLQ
jgi:hypothetical protein